MSTIFFSPDSIFRSTWTSFARNSGAEPAGSVPWIVKSLIVARMCDQSKSNEPMSTLPPVDSSVVAMIFSRTKFRARRMMDWPRTAAR